MVAWHGLHGLSECDGVGRSATEPVGHWFNTVDCSHFLVDDIDQVVAVWVRYENEVAYTMSIRMPGSEREGFVWELLDRGRNLEVHGR